MILGSWRSFRMVCVFVFGASSVTNLSQRTLNLLHRRDIGTEKVSVTRGAPTHVTVVLRGQRQTASR